MSGIWKSGFRRTKALISLKRGKIALRLLLGTNRKSNTCFRLVPKSTTLDELKVIMHSVSKHVHHGVVSSTFNVLLDRPVLTQIPIEESLGAGKTGCIARFPCDSSAFV